MEERKGSKNEMGKENKKQIERESGLIGNSIVNLMLSKSSYISKI